MKRIYKIMEEIDGTYKSHSGTYQMVRQSLFKLSNLELDGLYTMILTGKSDMDIDLEELANR
jgi:hypothetical protein